MTSNYAKISIVGLIFTVLSGCAHHSITASDNDSSAIDYTKKMVTDLSRNLDKIVNYVFFDTNNKNRHFSTFQTVFYPTYSGLEGVHSSWESYCTHIGGSYNNGACEDDNELPLFFAKTWYTGKRQTGPEVGVFIIEPKGNINIDYLDAANDSGYRTKIQASLEQAAYETKIIEASLKQRSEKIKNGELILNNGIGTRICKDIKGYGIGTNDVSVGFVERIENNKIKVLVQSTHLKNAPNVLLGGFKPHYIWDSPNEWYLC